MNVDLNSGWIRSVIKEESGFISYHPAYSLDEIIKAEEMSIPKTNLYIKHYDEDTLELTHCLTFVEAKRLLKLNEL